LKGRRILSPKQVKDKTSFSERHQRRLADEGRFPKPVRLGDGPHGRIGYIEDEIDRWLVDRVAERDGAKPMNGVATEPAPVAKAGGGAALEKKLRLPLAELGLPARACNALVADGLIHFGDLMQRSEVDLLGIPNIGRGSLAEIKAVLARHKLKLATAKTADSGD
jgi:prophage regulatory protein